jgi:membrane protein involved in colicin uptake
MTEPSDMTLVNTVEVVSPLQGREVDIKRRNNEKCTRYYYKHREELRERRHQKLMEDPEYVAKQEAKRVAKEEKERKQTEREAAKLAKAEREAQARAEREERRRQKAARVGLAV